MSLRHILCSLHVNMNSFKFLMCLLLVDFCATSIVSFNFKKCNRKQNDFNECLLKAAEDAIRQLNKPINETNLPNLEPLAVPVVTIQSGDFEQNLKNVKIFGFSKIQCSKLETNFEKKTLSMECVSPEVRMEFEYEVSGKILVLPIYGAGHGSITLNKLHYVATFDLEEFKKKEEKYFKAVDNKFVMEPELIKFKLENLFNGDEALGDNLNKAVNENWKDVFDEVRPSYEEAFAQVILPMFNHLFGKASISELFGEE